MDAVLAEHRFGDFGDDVLFPFSRTGLCRIEGESPAELRDSVRQFVPRVPGVYGMLDTLGRLIYVGKSKSLRNRLLSYFLPNNEEDKAGRIVQSTCAIVWERQPSEFAALLREQCLIRSFQPRYNVQGIPRRQQPIYICLGRLPAEQLYTARQNDPKAICVIGPLFGAARAARAVEVLNRVFRLRDCSSKQPCGFTDQLQLFDIELRPGCIRLEIGSCLGPCISACSRSVYARNVAKAQAFLEGHDNSPLDELREAMQTTANNLHFEQATILREDIKAVNWLSRRAADMAQARDAYTFVYPVAGIAATQAGGKLHSPQEIWYLIRRGIIEGALPAPKNATQRRHTKATLKKWLANDRCVGSIFSPRPETLALVASWFRNNRGELKKTFLPECPKSYPRRPRKSSTSSTVKV
jgi:excinuclease ABC subunit C